MFPWWAHTRTVRHGAERNHLPCRRLIRSRLDPDGGRGRVRFPLRLDTEFPLASATRESNDRYCLSDTSQYNAGMAKKPLALRVDAELLARVDAARGDVPRTRWVVRALESALGYSDVIAEAGSVESSSGPGRSAPSRASVPPEVVSAADEASMRQRYVEGALERVEKAKPKVPRVPGVQTAAELLAERQARLNKARKS